MYTEVSKYLGYNQIRNVLGVYDDDLLNNCCATEICEQLEEKIWNDIKNLAGGNPRYKKFEFDDMVKMLNEKYGLKYTGADDNNECHDFKDGKFILSVFPFSALIL